MKKFGWILIGCLLVIDIFLLFSLYKSSQKVLTVSFLNIGQGDSVFVETPSGHQLLIDAGPNARVLEELGRSMPWYDRSLDVVLATHPDADHIGGIPDVLKQFKVAQYIEPGIEGDSTAYDATLRGLEKELAGRIIARRGQVINFGDGVFLRILFPDRDMNGSETNTASVIAQLIYGETEFLLTGDAPMKIEQYVTELEGERLKSDVLKAGHHGSKTSTGSAFVAAVSPTYTVISAGKDNRYGHPHKDVLKTLQEASTTILGTYEQGRIVFTSDGKEVKQKTRFIKR